jgi:hypothetical protein
MDFSQLITLGYWNGLIRAHLPEIIMILTAAIVVVLDRYVRKIVTKFTSSYHVVSRFLVFLLVCSAGYTALALGVAKALRMGFNMSGIYAAPAVLGLLIIVAIEAQRQHHI